MLAPMSLSSPLHPAGGLLHPRAITYHGRSLLLMIALGEMQLCNGYMVSSSGGIGPMQTWPS